MRFLLCISMILLSLLVSVSCYSSTSYYVNQNDLSSIDEATHYEMIDLDEDSSLDEMNLQEVQFAPNEGGLGYGSYGGGLGNVGYGGYSGGLYGGQGLGQEGYGAKKGVAAAAVAPVVNVFLAAGGGGKGGPGGLGGPGGHGGHGGPGYGLGYGGPGPKGGVGLGYGAGPKGGLGYGGGKGGVGYAQPIYVVQQPVKAAYVAPVTTSKKGGLGGYGYGLGGGYGGYGYGYGAGFGAGGHMH